MKTNTMLVVVGNLRQRSLIASEYIQKGFNVVTLNTSESPDFHMVREIAPQYAVIDHADDVPGGRLLGEVLEEIGCKLASSEDPKFTPINESSSDRKAIRKNVEITARCEVSPKRPVVSCTILNISKTGARISAGGFSPKVGETVEIVTDNGIVVSGIVRWVKEDFGVEFGMKSQELV